MNEEQNQQPQMSPGPESAGGQPPASPGQGMPQGMDKKTFADRIMDAASSLYEKIIPAIEKSNNPVKTAGKMAGKVFYQILTKFNSEGVAIPKDVSRAVSLEILDDLLEIAENRGVVSASSPDEKQKMFMSAVSELAKAYIEAAGNRQVQEREAEGIAQNFESQQGGRQQPQGQVAQQGPPGQSASQMQQQAPRQAPAGQPMPQGQPMPGGYMEGM